MNFKTKRIERRGIIWVIQYVPHDTRITFDLFEVSEIQGGDEDQSRVGGGTLKWDGCLDISLDAGGKYLHFCGPEEEPFVGLVFREIYALGPEMRHWDYVEPKKPDSLPFIQCKSCSTVVNPEPEFMPCGGCGTAINRQTGEPFPFVLDAVMAPVVLGAQTVCKTCGGPERHRPGCQRDFVPCDQCECSHEPPACIIPLSPSES